MRKNKSIIAENIEKIDKYFVPNSKLGNGYHKKENYITPWKEGKTINMIIKKIKRTTLQRVLSQPEIKETFTSTNSNYTVLINPLSVNQCWQGQRFKSPKYKKYEKDLLLLLPKITISKPPYKLIIYVGFSNKLSDLDNINKPFQDILCKKYGFNDRDIYELHLIKEIVKKGEEFINFSIISI